MTIGYNANPIDNAPAAADLSSYQYCAVKRNSAGKWALCSTVGERADGILQNAPAQDEIADVVVMPGVRCKMKVGAGSLAPGDLLKVQASTGRGIAISAGVVNTSDAGGATDAVIGSYAVAVVFDKVGTVADGTVLQVIFRPGGVVPTTAA